MRRRKSVGWRFASSASASLSSLGGGPRQLYGLGLLLLAVLFCVLTFGGRVPRAVEKVFQPATVNAASLDARREAVANRLGGAWHDPGDGMPFAQTPGYHRLLRRLAEHARPADAVDEPPEFDRELAMRAPEMQRAELVAVRGIVVSLWAVKLDEPVFEHDAVWRVFLADNDGENGFVLDVLDEPPPLEERRDTLAGTAWFYRLVGYEATTGKQLDVPYLLARSIEIAPEEATNAGIFRDPARLVVAVGIVAMVVWGLIRVGTARPRPRVEWRAPHIG